MRTFSSSYAGFTWSLLSQDIPSHRTINSSVVIALSDFTDYSYYFDIARNMEEKLQGVGILQVVLYVGLGAFIAYCFD